MLPPSNNEYLLWFNNIKFVLEDVFGKDSSEYTEFVNIKPLYGINISESRFYNNKLNNNEIAILSILKKYETLGLDGISTASKPVSKSNETPNRLFDEMQFHPKIVEASKSCFVAGNYREAILNAFIRFIDFVKDLAGLDLDGDDLMNQAFSLDYDKKQREITKYPIIRINKLENISDRDEQQGFMFLCKGAVAGVRNPKAHKLILQTNPLHTLEYLALASLLIRRVEEGKVSKPKQSRINEEVFLARCRESNHQKSEELYLKAKELKNDRKESGDFINWGVSGYSYRMPWKTYPTGETLFTAYSDGRLQIWPDVIRRKSSGEAGKKYWEQLRSITSLAGEFTRNKYPTISTDQIKGSDIDAFIEAIKELGRSLDEITKEHKS